MPKKELAILPFNNLNPNDNHLRRVLIGFRSNLLSRLSRYPNLKVLSESFEPKTDKYFQGIIINTSFASVKGSVHILMAINSDNKTLRTLSYEEKESQLYLLEQKITGDIVTALFGRRNTNLTIYQKLSQKGYESLLLAQYYSKKFTPTDNDKAIAHFNKALKDNPNNSQALSGIAAIEFQQYRYGVHNYKKANQLRSWLEKALELDPENVQAHTTKALVAMYIDKDFLSAGISFQNALELERDYVDVLKEYVWFLLAISQDEEAFKVIDKALEYDPISVDLLTTKADIYRYREDYSDGLRWYEKAYKYEPSYSRSVEGMVTCHTNLNNKNEAYRYLEIYSRRSANEFFVYRVSCEVATYFDDSSLFAKSLKALEAYQMSNPQADLSSDLMTVYALTQPEKAIPYLEKAFKNGVGLVSIIRYPYLKKLWKTKTYKEFISQLYLDISLEELRNSQSRLLHIKSEGTESFTIARGLFAFAKAEGNYTQIHYIQNGKLTTQLLRLKLNSLDSQLEDDFFKRIHNSYLVNTQQSELELQGNAHKAILILKKFGVTLPVSRVIYKSLK